MLIFLSKMLMRKRPLRGEKVVLKDGSQGIALEPDGKEHFMVLMPNGKIGSILKEDIELPIINTKFYEKIKFA